MFVRRDENGKIVEAVSALPEGWTAEELQSDDPELVAAFTLPGSDAFVLPKMLLWTRLSDSEATTVEAAMSSQSAKMRGIWNSATEVRSDSEFFGILQVFLTGVLGDARAAEILAPL